VIRKKKAKTTKTAKTNKSSEQQQIEKLLRENAKIKKDQADLKKKVEAYLSLHGSATQPVVSSTQPFNAVNQLVITDDILAMTNYYKRQAICSEVVTYVNASNNTVNYREAWQMLYKELHHHTGVDWYVEKAQVNELSTTKLDLVEKADYLHVMLSIARKLFRLQPTT
jgi:hypothetical protein